VIPRYGIISEFLNCPYIHACHIIDPVMRVDCLVACGLYVGAGLQRRFGQRMVQHRRGGDHHAPDRVIPQHLAVVGADYGFGDIGFGISQSDRGRYHKWYAGRQFFKIADKVLPQ
jgi:hypothetical protein